MELSLVIPVYNEADNLPLLHKEMTEVCVDLGVSFVSSCLSTTAVGMTPTQPSKASINTIPASKS